MRGLSSLGLALLISGCSRPVATDSSGLDSVDDGLDTGAIDAFPDAPEPPEGGMQIATPTYRVEPYSEQTFCLFGSFSGDGPTAISYAAMYEDEVFGHHIQFNALREDADLDVEDGEVISCKPSDNDMGGSATTQLLSLTHAVPGGGEMILPEGYAVQAAPGTRWVLEYHIINTSARRVKSQGIVNLGFIDADEVDTWVSAYNFNAVQFNLPAGEETTIEVDCSWDSESEVLALAGHMHYSGRRFKVESILPDGSSETIYELDPWNPDWMYSPVVTNFEGGMTVPAGTVFRTTCTYFNSEDYDMDFPVEMCSASGLFGPSNEPYACDVEL